MEEITTTWSRKEFKAYLLLYAANANFIESVEEKELIRELVSKDAYKEMHRELDNDYQSIQKILHNVDKFGYTKEGINNLIQDIKKVFNADGSVDSLERNMLLAMKHLLK